MVDALGFIIAALWKSFHSTKVERHTNGQTEGHTDTERYTFNKII